MPARVLGGLLCIWPAQECPSTEAALFDKTQVLQGNHRETAAHPGVSPFLPHALPQAAGSRMQRSGFKVSANRLDVNGHTSIAHVHRPLERVRHTSQHAHKLELYTRQSIHSCAQALGEGEAYLSTRTQPRAVYASIHPFMCTGGAIIGDLPPYEAFPIGGTNSVRGYSEGGVGTGRRYAVGTAELHWPLPVSFLEVRHCMPSR